MLRFGHPQLGADGVPAAFTFIQRKPGAAFQHDFKPIRQTARFVCGQRPFASVAVRPGIFAAARRLAEPRQAAAAVGRTVRQRPSIRTVTAAGVHTASVCG